MIGYRKCRSCGVHIKTARWCGRCGCCRAIPGLTRGHCHCVTDHRPKGATIPVAGMSLSRGEPDVEPVPIPRDPYA